MSNKFGVIDSAETAFGHLEAFISGGDELGEVPEKDAIDAVNYLRARIAELEAEIENLIKADSKAVAEMRNALAISEANAERLANFIRYAMQIGALRGKRLAPKALEVLDEHEAVNGWRDE